MDSTQFPFINQLAQLETRTDFTTVGVLTRCDVATSTSGGEYLKIELSDRTGRFNSVVFSNHRQFPELRRAATGTAWIVYGVVDFYQQSFSPKLVSLDTVTGAALDQFADRLQRSAPVAIDDLRTAFVGFLGSISSPAIRSAVEDVLKTVGPEFGTSHAAQSMHHAYRHGLLYHTVSLCQLADAILPMYPRVEISRDIVIAALLLHDVGKVFEYTQGLSADVTQEMFLCGHIARAHELWTAAAGKFGVDSASTKRIGHCILAHHGSREHGSPVEPHTAEAWLVHLVDLIDARFAGIEELLNSEPADIVGRKSALGAVIRASTIR